MTFLWRQDTSEEEVIIVGTFFETVVSIVYS